jgi:hypothetical protein
MARMPSTIKVRLEVDPGPYWPEENIYCPCNGSCHREKSPCSFTCVGHDYAALQMLVRGSSLTIPRGSE